MLSRIFLGLSPILALLFLTACRGPNIDPSQRSNIGGTWGSADNGATLTVYSNGVFIIEVPATGVSEARRVRGKMERGRERVRVTYDSRTQCQDPAVYVFERTEGALRFIPEDEPCEARLADLDQPWVLMERFPSKPIR